MYSELWLIFFVPASIGSKFEMEEEKNISMELRAALFNYEAKFTFAVTPDFGFEPYWGDFAQIHDPTASTYARPVPKKGTTAPEKERPQTPPPQRSRNPKVCGEDCNFNYLSIRHVCAHHTSSNNWTGCWKPAPAPVQENAHCWNLEPDQLKDPFKEFDSYCAFLDANCREHFTAPKYILLHIGKCRTVNDWFKPVTNYSEVFDRLKRYRLLDMRNSGYRGNEDRDKNSRTRRRPRDH